MLNKKHRIFAYYHENTKQLKNKIKQKKICKTCRINVRNITYLIPYLANFLKVSSICIVLVSSIQKYKNLAIFKINKWPGECNYNHVHNILHFLIVEQFLLLPQVKWDVIIYKLLHELPNDLRLSTLGNIRKISKLYRILPSA